MPSLRKIKSGWHITVKYKNRAYRNTLKTKARANSWAEELLESLRAGKPVSVGINLTLEQAAEAYAESIGSLQAASGRTRLASNIRTITKHLGRYRLSAVSDRMILDEYVYPRLVSVSSDTIRRELSLLSQIFQFAKTPNPVPEIRRSLFQQRELEAPAKRDRRCPPDERQALIVACEQVAPWLASVVQLVLQTGMRRGELSSIVRSQVSDTMIQLTDTKTSKSGRVIPLSREAQSCVENLLALSDSEYLIPFAPRTISGKFKAACDLAGIKDLHFHDLRGECAHWLLEDKNLSIHEAAAMLGDSVRTLEKHYANNLDMSRLLTKL